MKAADVMQKGVISASPELQLTQFEELLTSEDIGGAPVVDESGNLIGIASKTDIVRALSEEFSEDFLELGQRLTVGDIMSSEVVTVGPDEDVKSLAQRMIDGHLHRIVVTDGEEVLGIVSSLDLLKLLT